MTLTGDDVSYVGGTQDALTIQNDELTGADLQRFLHAVCERLVAACRPGAPELKTAEGSGRATQPGCMARNSASRSVATHQLRPANSTQVARRSSARP